MATTQLATQDPTWFESIYAQANGNLAEVPWADEQASPALVNWLNAVAPSLIRCGGRVAVVGCGTGADARELIRRGYDVTAFDCSPTAIAWAQRLDPDNARAYHVADLFDAPAKWRHRFDLVVEVNTIQALEPDRRPETMAAITELCGPHGHVLVVCRHTTDPVNLDDGPPWPLRQADLESIANDAGMESVGPISAFMDDEDPPVARMRAAFTRR